MSHLSRLNHVKIICHQKHFSCLKKKTLTQFKFEYKYLYPNFKNKNKFLRCSSMCQKNLNMKPRSAVSFLKIMNTTILASFWKKPYIYLFKKNIWGICKCKTNIILILIKFDTDIFYFVFVVFNYHFLTEIRHWCMYLRCNPHEKRCLTLNAVFWGYLNNEK